LRRCNLDFDGAFLSLKLSANMMVRRCRLKPVALRVGSAWCQRLQMNCDELVSTFAFNFNLRRYMMECYFIFQGMFTFMGRGGAVQVASIINTCVELASAAWYQR
jgi:hypothetical protein